MSHRNNRISGIVPLERSKSNRVKSPNHVKPQTLTNNELDSFIHNGVVSHNRMSHNDVIITLHVFIQEHRDLELTRRKLYKVLDEAFYLTSDSGNQE